MLLLKSNLQQIHIMLDVETTILLQPFHKTKYIDETIRFVFDLYIMFILYVK